jgi:hypothetical protein
VLHDQTMIHLMEMNKLSTSGHSRQRRGSGGYLQLIDLAVQNLASS